MYQHRKVKPGGAESVVQLHLKENGLSLEDRNVRILARKAKWFEHEVKEAPIYNYLLKPLVAAPDNEFPHRYNKGII